MMKAVRLVQVGQPLELQELPIPEPGPQEALVQVKAAGICHSDAHYRAGTSPVRTLPVTPGHEVAGVVEQVGLEVTAARPGDRVALHYLVTCGACRYCVAGHEQFCPAVSMIGKHRDGGYAEYIALPARNAVPLPDAIPFEQGAILMCSSATSFHALRKSRLRPGETVAIFGLGGLGMSAVQLARAFGAFELYAVDLSPNKLALAQEYGAVPVDARAGDPVAEIRRLTGGRGVDVALELIGLPLTMRQAVQSLAVLGRAVIAGITRQPFEIYPYGELLGKEAEVLGADDHLLAELPLLIEYARRGILDLSRVVTATVPLDAQAINGVLDGLERYSSELRTVIVVEC